MKIVTKPDHSTSLVDSNGLASQALQNFFDDLETKLNADLFGVSVSLTSYTVATVPSAQKIGLIYVTDETGGAVPAFSDGTNWRRITDRAIVS